MRGENGGRPAKHTDDLKLVGAFRSDRHGDRENAPKAIGAPRKPAWTESDEASALWDRLVPGLAERGLVGQDDEAFLQAMCEVWGLYREAYELAQVDATDKDARIAYLGYFAAFQQAASKCGLTPMDRQKLRSPEKKEQNKGKARFIQAS